jgi:transcriptional regulator with XRE-family HTH domain
MQTFAERLKRAIDMKEMTGYALAKAADLDTSYISRLLRAERPPNLSYETARAVALALDVSTDWLMVGEGVGPAESRAKVAGPRAEAISIARAGGVDAEILEHAASLASPAGSEGWTTYEWICLIQYLATTRSSSNRPPPSTQPAGSEVRVRADIRTRKLSSSAKKS